MATTDTRLTDNAKSILASMIGKTLEAFAHDEYVVNPSTYMSAWLVVDGSVFEIHRETEVLDHFGAKEDVAVTNVRPASHDDMAARIPGRKLVREDVGRVIEDVKVIEDCQRLAKSDSVSGTYIFTAAIVFELAGTELVLESDTWFSEDIYVSRGPGASKRIPSAIDDIPKGDRKYTEVSREVASMREWML